MMLSETKVEFRIRAPLPSTKQKPIEIKHLHRILEMLAASYPSLISFRTCSFLLSLFPLFVLTKYEIGIPRYFAQ